jgi:epoxyqueuosine reductase QueG
MHSAPTAESSDEQTFETDSTQSRAADTLTVSSHGDLRWVQRSHEFECRPQQAWRRAQPVTLTGGNFDRVRYDAETETLLCVDGGVLTTVLWAPYEQERFQVATKSEQASAQHVCAVCGHGRSTAEPTCPQCGSRSVRDEAVTVRPQEGR